MSALSRRAGLLSAAALAAAVASAAEPPAPIPADPVAAALAAGLAVEDLKVGKGAPAQPGQTLTVHYTGWLYDPATADGKGKQFDSSIGREPFKFTLGAHQVIPGWELGAAGMQRGGERRLKIPPERAYGARGAGGGLIPPNATLLFEIRLLKLAPAGTAAQ